MSQFEPAVAKLMKRSKGFRTVNGEAVNFGVPLSFVKAHINPKATPLFIKQMSEDLATYIYREYFWDKCKCELFNEQPVAEAMFDLSATAGTATATMLMQRSINEVSERKCKVNFAMSDLVITMANACPGPALVPALKRQAALYFKHVAMDPSNAPLLADWLAMVDSWEA